MTNVPTRHLVHKTLHEPLTYFHSVGMPITRGMMWTAAAVALAVYVVFRTFVGAAGVLAVLTAVGMWSTHLDPQMWQLVGAASALRTRYDAAKYHGRGRG